MNNKINIEYIYEYKYYYIYIYIVLYVCYSFLNRICFNYMETYSIIHCNQIEEIINNVSRFICFKSYFHIPRHSSYDNILKYLNL